MPRHGQEYNPRHEVPADKQVPQSVFLPETGDVEGRHIKKIQLFNWKTLVVVGLVLALIGSAIGLTIGLTRGNRDSSSPEKSQYPDNVMRLCNLTRFPDVCNPALSSLQGADKASDTELVIMALKNARDLLQNVYGLSVSLNGSSNSTVVQAANDCMELLEDGIGSLNDTINLTQKLTAGQFDQIDNSSIPELYHFLSQVTTLNTDCAEALFGLSTRANATDAPANLDAAFQLAETVQMLLDNGAALVNYLPQMSQLIRDWQAAVNASDASDATFSIMSGVFNNVTAWSNAPSPSPASDDSDVSGRRRRKLQHFVGRRKLQQVALDGMRQLQELAFESDSRMPKWARRQLLSDFQRRPDATVAARKGTFRKVQPALNFVCSQKFTRRAVIYVAPGTYTEKVAVPKKCRVLIYGTAGKPEVTVITFSDSVVGSGLSTFKTATFTAKVNDFIMAYLTIKNEAGPENHQAVALRLAGIHQAVYQCNIDGYQDTLYAHNGVSYIRDATISGTVDFIFGNAATFFQSCQIVARTSKSTGTFNTFTAHGRTSPGQATGFVFNGCKVSADSGLTRILARPQSYRIYLGRPWKPYSRVIFANTYFPAFLNSKNWVEWEGSEDKLPRTVFFGEYKNYGPGYSTRNVISGVKLLSDRDMVQFSPANFLKARNWLPETGVPYK